MSRFFAASSSESESSSDEEEVLPIQPQPTKRTQLLSVSDEEEDVKRVVRSAKDKRFDEMRNIIKQMKNHKKIKDMSNVLTDFEGLGKAFDKAKKVVEQEGIPRFYIRCLVELEDFIIECWEDRDGRKQMSKNNAKGLTTLRGKMKRYVRDFEKDMAEYRENPDEGEEVSEEEVEEESEPEPEPEPSFVKAAPAKPEPKSKPPKDAGSGDESDDSMDWDMSESESSSSEDEEEYKENPAARFLKKKPSDVDKEKKEKPKKEKKRREKKVEEDDDEEWTEVKGGAPMMQEKPKMFAKDQEINCEVVIKKLMEIIAARGKKGTDRTEQIDLLTELQEVAKVNNLGNGIHVKIMFHIIAAVYDYNPNISTCMKSDIWVKCLVDIGDLLRLLIEHSAEIQVSQYIPEDRENVETTPYRVRGCMMTMVQRMNEEFTKMLQACDAHSTEYVDRLKDEPTVCDIIDQLIVYLEKIECTTEELCRAYLLKVEHVYYKFDNKTPELSKEIVDEKCQYIYTHDKTDRIRAQAILCHIYHNALHDRWFEARDLMLMSHLQDTVHHSDVPTQIAYNRTMVQLGLCAFRQGMIRDAHNCLVDIQSGGRAKELLAQGLLLQRQHERTPEQEKIEKRRQMPYHMHINLELLECAYLVSAMLLEVPYIAAHELDARRRMISKYFHHVLRVSERQTLVGQPESMREHVVQASKAMKRGDWRACKGYIINEKMNAKVWDLFYESDRVRSMIVDKIQEESLRTYMFSYSSVYDSISMLTLAEMFELDKAVVHSVISKMIINEELMASLDEPTLTVMMHRTEPSRLQSLALQLSEKVSNLVDNNERLMEIRSGTYTFYNKQGGGNQNYQQNQDKPQWQKRDGQQYQKRDGQQYQKRDGQQNYQKRDGQGGWQKRDGQQWNRRGNYNNRQQRTY